MGLGPIFKCHHRPVLGAAADTLRGYTLRTQVSKSETTFIGCSGSNCSRTPLSAHAHLQIGGASVRESTYPKEMRNVPF